MVIAIPCAVGFITLAKPILNMLYFTQDNTTAALMLQMGALSVVFFCLSTVTNSVLQGLDDMMTPVKNAAISLVIHIVTLFLMLVVLKWNIYAVVLSKIIFSGAICVLNAKDCVTGLDMCRKRRRLCNPCTGFTDHGCDRCFGPPDFRIVRRPIYCDDHRTSCSSGNLWCGYCCTWRNYRRRITWHAKRSYPCDIMP